jgi:hypothetical protein
MLKNGVESKYVGRKFIFEAIDFLIFKNEKIYQ